MSGEVTMSFILVMVIWKNLDAQCNTNRMCDVQLLPRASYDDDARNVLLAFLAKPFNALATYLPPIFRHWFTFVCKVCNFLCDSECDESLL